MGGKSGISFDTTQFEKAAAALYDKALAGASIGVQLATEDLFRESEKLAPLEKGTLRNTKWLEFDESDELITGEVHYSVTESGKGGRFNYALYMHEFGGRDEFANPTTPGTQPKFLEQPLKMYAEEYKQIIAKEIKRAIK